MTASVALAARRALRLSVVVELGYHIKSVIGISARIDVHDPGDIARSEGKAKRVIDNRPKR